MEPTLREGKWKRPDQAEAEGGCHAVSRKSSAGPTGGCKATVVPPAPVTWRRGGRVYIARVDQSLDTCHPRKGLILGEGTPSWEAMCKGTVRGLSANRSLSNWGSTPFSSQEGSERHTIASLVLMIFFFKFWKQHFIQCYREHNIKPPGMRIPLTGKALFRKTASHD